MDLDEQSREYLGIWNLNGHRYESHRHRRTSKNFLSQSSAQQRSPRIGAGSELVLETLLHALGSLHQLQLDTFIAGMSSRKQVSGKYRIYAWLPSKSEIVTLLHNESIGVYDQSRF